MAPRIVFVIMSAVARPATVDQLARALTPHQVLVHHDFAQTPEFRLEAGNASFVPDPRRTGWASFGFVEGIFHSLAHAVAHLDFDYLQLLSPTCLPVKPLAQFEAHVRQPVDAHFGAIDLLSDEECMANVSYRAFTAAGSLQHRLLRRLSRESLRAATGRRHEAGVWLRSGGKPNWRATAARLAVRAAAAWATRRPPFAYGLRPYYGSAWFGAKPRVVRGLVEAFADPGLRAYFSRLRISEEFLIPTLLMRLAPNRGPLNHYISRFDEAHPMTMGEADLDELRSTPAFFARKFCDDPCDPLRLRVLDELVSAPTRCAAAA
ncbi:MAG: hypothetical protein JWP43_441 [Ramlibacter sp.]|nr:hypothetical protein [Ramlibacter sp.]